MDRLQALEAFVRTVQQGSFSAAARDLGVTQSTVSKWVAALEAELDVKLLDRTTRSLRTTPAGARLLEEGRSLLSHWADTVDQVRHQPLAGLLRVGLPAVFGSLHVVPLLPAILDQFPGLRLDLRFSDRRTALLTTDHDLLLRLGPTPDSSHQARLLGRSRRVLVASPAYLADRGQPVHPTDLALHTILPHLGPPDAPWTLQHGDSTAKVSPPAIVTCNHSQAALQLAEAGLGIARLAEWLVARAVSCGRLVEVLPEWSAGEAAIRAVWAPEGPGGGRRRRAFLDALQPLLSDRLAQHRVGPTRQAPVVVSQAPR